MKKFGRSVFSLTSQENVDGQCATLKFQTKTRKGACLLPECWQPKDLQKLETFGGSDTDADTEADTNTDTDAETGYRHRYRRNSRLQR